MEFVSSDEEMEVEAISLREIIREPRQVMLNHSFRI